MNPEMMAGDTPSQKKSIKASAPVFGDGLSYWSMGGEKRRRKYPLSERGAALAAILMPDIFSRAQVRTDGLVGLGWQLKRRSGVSKSPSDEIIADNTTTPRGNRFLLALRNFRAEYKYSFFEAWYYSMLIAGDAYLHAIPGTEPDGRPGRAVGLEWYNPVDTDAIRSGNAIVGYQYHGGNTPLTFTPSELVHAYRLNLHDETRGYSPAIAAINSINLIATGGATAEAYLTNGMRMGALIAPKSGELYDQEQIAAQAKKFNEQARYPDRKFSDIVLPFSLDVHTPPRIDFSQDVSIIKLAKEETAMAFRVPDVLVAATGESRFKQSNDDSFNTWLETVIKPDAESMAEIVNNSFLPAFGIPSSVYFSWNLSFLSRRISRIEKERVQVKRDQLEDGGITIAEFVEDNGTKLSDASREALSFRYLDRNKGIIEKDGDIVTLDSLVKKTDDEIERADAMIDIMGEPEPDGEEPSEAMTQELKAWRKFTAKSPKRDFVFEVIKSEPVIEALLGDGSIDDRYDEAIRLLSHPSP